MNLWDSKLENGQRVSQREDETKCPHWNKYFYTEIIKESI